MTDADPEEEDDDDADPEEEDDTDQTDHSLPARIGSYRCGFRRFQCWVVVISVARWVGVRYFVDDNGRTRGVQARAPNSVPPSAGFHGALFQAATITRERRITTTTTEIVVVMVVVVVIVVEPARAIGEDRRRLLLIVRGGKSTQPNPTQLNQPNTPWGCMDAWMEGGMLGVGVLF